MFICKIIGPIIGTIVKTIWIKSKKNPRKKIKAITKKTAPKVPPGRFSIKLLIISLPSRPINTSEKIFALISIKKIIELIFVVSKIESLIIFNEKLLLKKLKIIAPMAPKEAASVGVAMPNKIEPNTTIIRNIGRKITFKIFWIVNWKGT